MLSRRLMEYLDEHNMEYHVISHLASYTGQETAEQAHVSGKELAKTVIVNINGIRGEMVMIVLPASQRIDFDVLKESLGVRSAELVNEEVFKDSFPDCEVGAMPPFGNLYNLRVFVDVSLAAQNEIIFNAGNHQELIKMAFADYRHLARPKIVHVTHAPVVL